MNLMYKFPNKSLLNFLELNQYTFIEVKFLAY